MADFVQIDPTMFQRTANLVDQGSLLQAQVEETKVNNEQKRFALQQQTDAFQRRQAFLASMAGNQPGQPPLAGMQPQAGKDYPDAKAETGQPPDITPLKQADKNPLDAMFEAASRDENLGRAAEAAGLPEMADKFRDNARVGRKDAMEAQQKQDGITLQRFQKAEGFLAAIDGEDSANLIMDQLDGLMPGMSKGFGLTRDQNGRIEWNQANIDKIAALKKIVANQIDQRKAAVEEGNLVVRGEELKRRQERDEQIAQLQDQKLSLQRQGLADKAQAIQDKLDLLKAQQERKSNLDMKAVEDRAQRSLEKNDAYKTLPKYEQAYQQSQAILQAIGADKEYKQISAPQIDTLKNAFTAMEGLGRTQRNGGGKWESQNIERFNGFLQNAEKWVRTIGQGTPAVDRTTALNMIGQMQNMYAVAAGETLKAELDAMNRVKRQGGDPRGIITKIVDDDSAVRLLMQKGFLKVKEKTPSGKPLKIELFGKTYDSPNEEE